MHILIWFHRDLRTHDHEGLSWALANGSTVQAAAFAPHPNSSKAKSKFWRESTADLAQSLRTAGIPLQTFDCSPAEELKKFVSTHSVDLVLTHRRMNYRDRLEVSEVAKSLPTEVREVGQTTLFDSEMSQELNLAQLKPFTRFKNHAMKNWSIPKALVRAPQIQFESAVDQEWDEGGERSGLNRVDDYIWKSKSCLHYHETRNGMLTRDDSSKFSRWLAWGALSPRYIHDELLRFQAVEGPSPGVDALIYELVWRDYFKFLAELTQEKFFDRDGLGKFDFVEDSSLFERWKAGECGEEFVDACMRELLLTGWMSNRGRQNVASFLAKIAGLDWTLGAKWFEQNLIDDDPENNWGNWLYLAGVGTDPRNRQFDPKRQAEFYDPLGLYRNKWLSS